MMYIFTIFIKNAHNVHFVHFVHYVHFIGSIAQDTKSPPAYLDGGTVTF